MRVFLIGLILLACGAVPAQARRTHVRPRPPQAKAQATVHSPRIPRVIALRFWSGPENTRLVLDLNEHLDVDTVVSADRLTINLRAPGFEAGPDLQDVSLADSVVERVRFLKATGGGLRVEVTLRHPGPFRVATLSAAEGRSPRLVLDVQRYFTPEQVAAQNRAIDTLVSSRQRIVVLDPGHGGDAPGAQGPRGTGLLEKDVTLAVGKRVARLLGDRPGIKVVMTREGDYDVPLRRRFAVGERYQADCFVSIHCNASRDRDAHGTEVYFLSLNGASDEAARGVADFENSSDVFYNAPDPRDEVKSILFDLRQSDTIRKSSSLAELVLGALQSRGDLVFRGVKQAGFAVLKSPLVPAILVETAFITNRSEAARLGSPDFQEDMALMIANGIVQFLDSHPSQKRGGPSPGRGGVAPR